MEMTWPGWKNDGLLGEGSFGRVYRISREEFGTVYKAALKVITIPQSDSDIKAVYDEGMDEKSATAYFRSFVEDMVAEFALMSRLKGNSHIVSYEDHMVVQHEDGIGWDILIRMELLTGLNDYVREKPLGEADVIRLGCHIAMALETCKRKGILHRDIKSENVFVSEEGNFKLGDFGIARVAEKTTSMMSKKGTYSYMAPEVYRGGEYGFAADLYSLGIMLYRFLNDNRAPFLPSYPQEIHYNDRERALMERMSGKEIPAPAHGSEALKRVILKLVAYRPEDRYTSPSEVVDAFQQLQGGTGTAYAKPEQDVVPEVDENWMDSTISLFNKESRNIPAPTETSERGDPGASGNGGEDAPADMGNQEKDFSASAVMAFGIKGWLLLTAGVLLCLTSFWTLIGFIAGPVCLILFYKRFYSLKVWQWCVMILGVFLTTLWPAFLFAGILGAAGIVWISLGAKRK